MRVKTRRALCDDELGWIVVKVWPFGMVSTKHYKTFAGAQKQLDDFQQSYPKSKAFLIQLSEAERWHKSTGIDELERLMRL